MDLQEIPFHTDCTANSIDIKWQGQHGHVNNYIVRYRDKDNKDKFAVERTSESKIHMSNLRNGTLYEIRIYEEDPNGDESLSFKTEVRTLASVASKLLESATKICDDPIIYRLHPVKITNLPEGIQISEVFSETNNTDERSLLLLGASGSGKSTLVDAIINFVTDVSFADNFRLKITDEIRQGEEDIVCYKIRCQEGFKIGFNLNIIDVPGFESEYNESIYKKILALFQSVRYIGAACLVVPSFCRLTEENRRIFNNIASIFGNDINYLIPLITFDDGGEIKALSSLKAAKVLFFEHMHFVFNNSHLFSGKEHFEIWAKRQKTMQDLFGEPTVFVNCSVEKTIKVLKTRNILKQSSDDTESLKRQIEQKENVLKAYDLRKRKQQSIRRNVETNSPVRKVCINCKMCKQTCVYDCTISVRFFWYFVILLEKFWSFICCICSCCRCCSRCRCLCKLPYCCCIKCLHRCLGCTCSCSLGHHEKEYGRYKTNERDILKDVHDIEGQSSCVNKDDEEILHIQKRSLMRELDANNESRSRHMEFIKTTALLNEVPNEI